MIRFIVRITDAGPIAYGADMKAPVRWETVLVDHASLEQALRPGSFESREVVGFEFVGDEDKEAF